jgi:hypothetical protein
MVTERSKIIKNYLKGKFFWDLIVIIPFMISLRMKIKYLDMILLLRSNKMRKIALNFEEMLNL